MSDQKRCPKCGETKDKSEFYKDESKYDGCCTMCMVCKRAACSAYYHAHKEQRRAYYLAYREKYGW